MLECHLFLKDYYFKNRRLKLFLKKLPLFCTYGHFNLFHRFFKIWRKTWKKYGYFNLKLKMIQPLLKICMQKIERLCTVDFTIHTYPTQIHFLQFLKQNFIISIFKAEISEKFSRFQEIISKPSNKVIL